MFSPPAHRVSDHALLLDLVERARFGHLVSHGEDGFACTGLPFLVDRDRGTSGWLRCHFARANPQWRTLDGAAAFVLFPLADGYVSPAWYPSKRIDGKAVPTWNYEVVQVEGIVHVRDDRETALRIVDDLSSLHEAARTDPDPEYWSVSDAPDNWIEKMLRAIVAAEIEITSIEGARKLSGNRPEDDQVAVVAGLDASTRRTDHELAAAMRDTPD